jgi:signal transduction histidine kinase
MIGQSVLRLLPDDRQDEESTIIDRIKAGQRVDHFETMRRRRDGSLADVSLTVSPIRDRAGKIVGASKILRDIGDRRSNEDALRQANEKLQQANADLENFVYTASHDLRSPLNGVNSVVQWILDDDQSLSRETRERLGLIHSRIERMRRLLNDIRDYARMGQFEQPAEVPLTAAALVADTVAMSDMRPGFSVRIDPALAEIAVARVPLEQVFHNLINNAIKHHDRSTGTVQISVERGASTLRFSVIDDGPGVPAEYRDEIFDLFKTLKPRDSVEGSGMGLALVRRIVTKMGGHCGVRPAGNRGSDFWFDWPQLQPRSEEKL